MNPALLGVFWLLVCSWSKAMQEDRLNSLNLSQNRDLFLSALQAYFRRKGIHIDRTAPSFVMLSSKSRSHQDSYPDGFLHKDIRAQDSERDLGWENV